jgi:hypothetical protein
MTYSVLPIIIGNMSIDIGHLPYILLKYNKFLNKTNGQTLREKSTMLYVKTKREVQSYLFVYACAYQPKFKFSTLNL